MSVRDSKAIRFSLLHPDSLFYRSKSLSAAGGLGQDLYGGLRTWPLFREHSADLMWTATQDFFLYLLV